MSGQGAELAGRYHLAEKIGEGGMGSVWVATDDRAGGDAPREVAVKVLHKTLVSDPAAIARFRHEANVASGIAHPNLCRVLDVGESDGAPFLVMERLRGENLADRLSRESTLPPTTAVEIVLELLAGLEAAHAQGVLHRDLKPENVFLAREGDRVVAKVLDFGVSKFIGDDVARVKMTRTGALVGTPAYMSPEQVLGEADIDVRSDVWAVGVLLYETLAGKLPYDAANYNTMLVKIATESPRPIAAVLPALDEGLCAVVGRALARDRDDRFASAAEMSAALRGWLAGAPLTMNVRRVAMPTPLIGTTPMSWAEQASGEPRAPTQRGLRAAPRRHAWLLPSVLVVVLGVAGLAVAIGVRRSSAAVVPAGQRPASDASPSARSSAIAVA
ncbi:MAG: serine/threonine-protein kinase [Deltaproteobacteria bacterium]